ncbi:preprotein translocase subunit SecG [Stratiformator vulcanicus]|uniref:Protein-export membrane protein SecG n=1 Tax=Stratiformator vulcanicus TaxID=2527980 RepID=A0A517R6F4_9PLAN|nr:preprotein translocase subunit SecG [Stratiformator vulcanicus]QDT39459.1 preprotein translocase subunit SecG [Stratiformator vulcanicus]
MLLVFASVWSYITMTLLMIVGLLLMFIILLQRGRGGGLAGAFGGAGGQSAFGTKAGDVFTRITIVVTVVWVALAAANGFQLRADAVVNADKFKPSGPAIESTEDGEDIFGPAESGSAVESSGTGEPNPFEELESGSATN